ncbi:alpha/beta hydrolase [Flavobacterium notoginsengisoli]|uniref:alpha/beta hydrolase n=1 Tax=Flavobacterium notoginsengisoli TaxID=1478199 RepID=UPI00363B80D8
MLNNKIHIFFKIVHVLLISTYFNQLLAQKSIVLRKEIENSEQYNSEEINFIDTEDNTLLSGTFIFPKTEYSKIVIITPGSGKDTRNSHYKLAEELLKNNIGVYRFDDRGVGKSGGTVNFSVDQIIRDLYCVYKNIRTIHSLSNKNIGILGHSLGGIAAIENHQKGINPDFIILLSTPVEKYGKFKNPQFSSKNNNSKSKVSALNIFENIDIPLLFIAGTNDTFFNTEKTINLINALNNKKINTTSLKGLDHFLTKGKDDWKQTKDYHSIYEIDKTAVDTIVKWIQKT